MKLEDFEDRGFYIDDNGKIFDNSLNENLEDNQLEATKKEIAEIFDCQNEDVNEVLGSDKLSRCLECDEKFLQERDIQLCDRCVDAFDLERLWKQHDASKIDALDFNESEKIRERFRIGGK